MSMKAGRAMILEPVQGEHGMEAPTELLAMRLRDLVGTLMTVGGEFTVRADRVRIGELPGAVEVCAKCNGDGERAYDGGKVEPCRACNGDGEKPGRPDVISETLGFFIEWRNVPRLSDEPMTARAMDYLLRDDPEQVSPEDVPTVEEVAAAVAAPDDDEIADSDEPEE